MSWCEPPARQGHALFTRQPGSLDPCPLVDFDGGFNQFLAAAYNLPPGVTVEAKFGAPFDPFLNDQNYVLCVLTLEELGATGNKARAPSRPSTIHPLTQQAGRRAFTK